MAYNTYLDYNKTYDFSQHNPWERIMSLPEEERQKQVALLQSVGLVSPDDNGFLGEMSDRFNQAFHSGMRGIGSTIDELGFGDALEQHFDKILRTNRQWDAPEDVGVAGYIGGALGSAAGSSAVTLGATAAGGLLGGPKGAMIAGGAAIFAQTFGDNVKRNRKAGYSEDRALGMAFLESGVDSLIENAPWGVVGKAGKMATTAGRLRKISAAGKKELLNKIGQRMSAQIGKEQTQNLLLQWGKQATLTGLGESGEEGLQSLNSFVNQKLGGDPNAKFSINELADAMAQGFIGGFGLGGVQSVPGIRHEAQMRAVKPELSDEAVPLQERNLLDRLVVDIGSDLGIKVDFMDNRPDRAKQEKISNGFYDKSNKTLYLNRNTYNADPMETLGHELKHYIDDNIPELSKAFDALLESGKNEAGKARPSEIAQMFDYSAEKGNNEFSADMFGKLFARQDTWAKTAESLESKTPGMGEKFLQTVREFLALIKARLTGTPEAETYLNNVTELETEVGRMLAELRRRNGNSSQVENVIGAKGNTDVESVPVSQINVDAQRFQFKSNTSKISGVDESNKLGGDWDPRTAGNLYLWEDKNGKLYVVNGHHRFELAQRNGVENINAIIDRETDGITAEQARRNGVLINIRDGQGDVRDYASFVRSENLSEQEAEAQGVTARKKGRAGFLLGKAGDTLYEAYINEVIPESKAVIIAEVANGNEAVEYAGIKLATDRKLAGETLRQTLKLVAQNTSGKKTEAEQGGLFDMVDDSVLQEWETIGKLAIKHIDDLKAKIKSRKSAVKNPEAAREGDIKVGKNAEKLLSKTQEELARWENYATDPELMAQLREEAGITPQEVVSETENTTAPGVAGAEIAQTTLAADEDTAGLFEAQEETVSKKESVEPVVKENLTTETAATPKENLAVDEKDKGDIKKEPLESHEKMAMRLKKLYEDIPDRTKEVGMTYDDFVVNFQKRRQMMVNAAIKKFVSNKNSWYGTKLIDAIEDASNDALVKAYRLYTPEKGALENYVSVALKHEIISAERKAKKNREETGGDVSLNQTNDQGEELGEAVADENESKEYDVISARENPEEAKRRIPESEKLSPTQKKIVELFNQGFSPSQIIRKLGVRFGEEGHEYMSNEEFQQQITAIRTIADEEGIVYSRKWGTEENGSVRNGSDLKFSRKILHQQITPIVRDGKVKDEHADLLERKGYTPETIEKWQNQAFDWIERQGGVTPAAEALINDKAPSDGHVAELARRLVLNSDVFANHVDKADRVKLYELEIDARSAWGRAGRAMQLNALNLQDVASVQALLNKLHKDMPNADLLKLRNQIKKELDVDIFELDDKIVNDKEKLDAVLRAHLAKKAQWHDKLYEYWINAILSGPGTHASNLLGNTANMAYELGIKRFTEALVNVAMGRKDGATFGEFREMLKAFNWSNAAKAFVQAKNIEVLDPSGKFLESQGVAIGGKTGRFIRTPGRLLKAADAFAKALIQPMETAAYAYRMGMQKGLSGAKLQAYIQQQLTDKDSAAYEWAAERAKELTFQGEPGSAVKALMHLRETKGPAGVALKLMLPFLKTPANILRQGVRKSPLGAINLAYETGKILTGKGEFDGKYVSRVAEQLIAWGAVMALAGMGDDDELPIITGSTAPYGSAEYNYKAKNIPPYSIRIGDNYYSYQRIEPLATGLAAIADGIQAMRDARNGKDGSAVIKELLFNGIKIAGEKSYLDSIGEMLKLVEDPERHGMRPATNLLASSVPKLVTQISQAMSENVGDSKSRNKGLEWWKDQFHIVTNRAGVTVPIPKIDFFGREVKKDDFGDTLFSPIGRLLPVKRFEADNMDPAERLIWNYNRKNPNSEYYPPLLRNTFTVNKEKLYFAGKDYHDYAVEAGKLAHRQINNAIRAGVIKVNNPTDKDIEIIKRIFSRARKETQSKFIKRAKKDK